MSVLHPKSNAEFQALKASADKLTIIDYSAAWCGPCKMIYPDLVKLAEANTNVVFVKVDVDEAAEMGIEEASAIDSLPTFHYYRDGMLMGSVEGANIKNVTETMKKFA